MLTHSFSLVLMLLLLLLSSFSHVHAKEAEADQSVYKVNNLQQLECLMHRAILEWEESKVHLKNEIDEVRKSNKIKDANSIWKDRFLSKSAPVHFISSKKITKSVMCTLQQAQDVISEADSQVLKAGEGELIYDVTLSVPLEYVGTVSDLVEYKRIDYSQFDVYLFCPVKGDSRYDDKGEFSYSIYIFLQKAQFLPSDKAIKKWAEECNLKEKS